MASNPDIYLFVAARFNRLNVVGLLSRLSLGSSVKMLRRVVDGWGLELET